MHHAVRNVFIGVILLALVVTGVYSFSLYRQTPSTVASVSKTQMAKLPIQDAQAQEKVRVVSSIDGSKVLTMKTNPAGNDTTYTFFATSSAQPFFTETLPQNYSLGVPDNAWAPGEKYIFLEKNGGGVKTDLVFHPDGSPFANGEPYLDVRQMFTEKNLPYNFAGATGWADGGLLIVETTNSDGTTGPSFWFELPLGSFIHLAQHQ